MTKVRLSGDSRRQRGAYGVEMQDGTKYNADRRGVINVDNKAHLRAMKNMDKFDFSTNMPTGFSEVVDEGKWCPRCKFHGFKWQSSCPRDGEALR